MLPYELPITFTNRFLYRFLVKNGVEYIINPFESKENKLKWNESTPEGALQILAILFDKSVNDFSGKNEMKVGNCDSIPFSYRISHKRGKYRELAIIHPADQIKMVAFYEKFKSLILYYCQQSRFSLRHPHAVACYFYYRDRLHNTLLGRRSDNVELFFNEYENLKTFFSYKRYTQIYRFYEDYRYQRAEKKFSNLRKFDIQSCFNSIYTHSIAWATNGGKSIYKQFFKCKEDGTFGYIWDSLMQKMNFSETNGIVIGPEFSRIFAEIILQYVDCCVENDLLAKGYRWNVDYECYRYVDDYFFFYNNPNVLETANESFAHHLNEYKLSISKEKTEDFVRPFITPISRAKLAIDRLIKDTVCINLEDDLLRHNEDEEETKDESIVVDREEEFEMNNERLEKALKKKHSLYFRSSYFSSTFQDILKTYNVEAKEVLNYAISRIATKCERVLKTFDSLYKPLCLSKKIKNLPKDQQSEVNKRKRVMERELSIFLFNLLDSSFFIYSFNKQVNSTLKMMSLLNNIIIYLDNEYTETNNAKKEVHLYKRFTDDIRANVFKKIQDEINVVFQSSHYNENVQLETLYFLITLRSMRNKYFLPPISIENYLGVAIDGEGKKQLPCMNALSITLLLYYFRKKENYSELRKLVIAKACERMQSVPKTLRKKTTELVLLLLDLMACPFLEKEEKEAVGQSFGLKKEEVRCIVLYVKNGRYMFTNWSKLNISKELNAKISQEVYS